MNDAAAPVPDALSALVAQTAVAAGGDVGHWLRTAFRARQDGLTKEARALLDAAAVRFPLEAHVLHDLAQLEQAERNWPAAERHWRAYASMKPAVWWGYTEIAHTLREQGRLAEADVLLADAQERFPHEAGVAIHLARMAEFRHDWPEAVTRWALVSERFPDAWEGPSGEARALRQLQRPDKARALLIRTVERFPSETGPLHDLARLEEAERRWPDAERCWRAYLGLDPTHWWAHSGLALALREQGRMADAEAQLTQAQDRFPNEAGVFIDHARLAEFRRDWAAAVTRWRTVTERFPGAWEGLAGEARALREQGRPNDARGLLVRTRERFPRATGLLHDLVRLEEMERNWPAAERCWRDHLALDPTPWWAHAGLANALREQRRIADAEQVLLDACVALPDQPEILIALARHAEAVKNWPQAAQRWHDVCRRFPHLPSGPAGAADALRACGQLDQAGDVLRLALERFPRSAELYVASAKQSEALGRIDEALAHIGRAITRDPGNSWHYWHLSRLYAETSATALAEQALLEGLAATGAQRNLLMSLAHLSEREADWAAAEKRFGECLKSFPDETGAAIGLASAMSQQGKHAQGDAILTDAMDRFPKFAALAVAFIRSPLAQGIMGFAESLRRARLAVLTFPDSVEVCRMAGHALLINALPAEAETFLRSRLARLDGDKSLRHMLSTALVRQGKWDLAFDVFAELVKDSAADQSVYREYADALISAKRWDHAQALIAEASARFPAEASFGVSMLDILIARNDLVEAMALWKRLDARSDGAPLLRRDLFDRRGRLLGLGIDPIVPERTGPAATGRCAGPEIRVEDIAGSFESLGGTGQGCEFGLFQRFYGAEPLGLLRWTTMHPHELLAALDAAFDGVGTPEQTVLRAPDGGNHLEYGASDRRFGMVMHTFVRADQVPEDKMFVQLCRRLTYLRTKLLEDLREGSKIFVYKTLENLPDGVIGQLHGAVRRYGDTTLLYVRLQDENRRFPLVEAPERGLLIGNIDRFSNATDGTPAGLPATSWAAVARNAFVQWQDALGRNTSRPWR